MKTNVIRLVIVCFLLNGFVPRSPVADREHENLFSLLANQPLLQCYYSLSNIPIAIVTKLLNEDTGVPAASRNSREQKRQPAGASAEFSLSASERLTGKRICTMPFFSGFPAGLKGIAVSPVTGGEAACPQTAGTLIHFLLLCLLCIMLPRGGLADAAAALFRNRTNETRSGSVPGWVFSLRGADAR